MAPLPFTAVDVLRRRLSPPVSPRKKEAAAEPISHPNYSAIITTSAAAAATSTSSSSRSCSALFLALLLAAVCLSLFTIYKASILAQSSLYQLPGLSMFRPAVVNVSRALSADDRLKEALMDAATEDNTVILTTLNEAWAAPNSVFDIFVQSFQFGNGTEELLDHLLVIALDKTAYTRCLAIHSHCYALVTEGVDFSKEASFMSPEYLKMMWRRIDLLRTVLELGFNFVFTDADVMWFRNPFPQFHEDADFQIACDSFVGKPDDLENRPNGGFNFVRSNNRSAMFYRYWYSSQKTYPGCHDQEVLDRIKNDSFIRDIGLKMIFLDTAYFGGLCEPSRDLNKVCTMHANCCVGLARKINDLKVMLNDWRLYMSLPSDLKRLSIISWSVPQKCSLSPIEEKTTAYAPAPVLAGEEDYGG